MNDTHLKEHKLALADQDPAKTVFSLVVGRSIGGYLLFILSSEYIQ